MNRTTKILVIFIVILGVALLTTCIYFLIPGVQASMNYYLGPTGHNILEWLHSVGVGIRTSNFWVTFINPNVLWIGMALGVLATVFLLNPLKDAFTGFWAGRHKVTVRPSTTVATAGGVVRSTTPAGATTRPTVTATPVVVEEQKQEPPKEEDQKTT